jgi:hypothetical protein
MKFLAALASALIMAALGVAAPSASATTDNDGDSVDDGLEDLLAAQFFPWVWYDSGENAGCTNPATTAGNPGTALARVRPHPADASKIAIQYVILYQRDCGDFGGFSAHAGDVEAFSVALAPNPACPYGYGAFSLKTVAHEGQIGEHTDQRLLGNSCTWGRAAGGSPYVARIYASENKHGNYASDSSCDSSLGGLENCSESFTLPYNVFNIGEDNARRIDELSGYQFPGEYAWSDVPFRGGLGNGLGDAGTVRAKMLNDGLLAIGSQPPPSTRCNQPAHAWYQTPSRDQSIRQGQLLLVIAAGVMPDTVAVFNFHRDGQHVAYYQTRWANKNCVVNQEYVAIWLPPATYQVTAVVEEPVSIGGTLTKTIGQPDLIVLA